MKTNSKWRSSGVWNGLVLLTAVVSTLETTGWCMGASPVSRGESQISPDHYAEGREKGWNSGFALGENIASKVLGTQGCSGLWKAESAIVRVMREVRVPADESPDSLFGKGYLKGYLEGLSESGEKTRGICEQRVHETGAFAGQLFGGFACAAARVDFNWLLNTSLEPLYEGWAGDRRETEWECRSAATEVLSACLAVDQVTEVEFVLRSACEVQ